MKIARAVKSAGEGQADCFWHDHSESLRYVLMLHGVVPINLEPPTALVVAQTGGSVTSVTVQYQYLTSQEPGLLPWDVGPFTVMLIL